MLCGPHTLPETEPSSGFRRFRRIFRIFRVKALFLFLFLLLSKTIELAKNAIEIAFYQF